MKRDRGFPYYPVFLDIKGKKCVVVGGGQVALRKVKVLLEHGADVEVISPDLCPELTELARSGAIRMVARGYQAGDLKKAFVAIAATDNDETNQRVASEARKNSVLINVVDNATSSDFILPSYLRRGQITVAVSTNGVSPALARKIRSRLEEELGEEYGRLASLIGETRTEVRQQKINVNGDDWQEALDLDRLLDLLRRGQEELAKATLLSNLKAKQH